MIIAKRSLSLSKTYAVIGIFLALVSVLIASIPSIMSVLPGGIHHLRLPPPSGSLGGDNTSSSNNNATVTSSSALNIQTVFPFISIPLQVFASIAFTTPVLLLYVYDKNNGVLEYFLSLGLDQGDIYRRYLRASLILAGCLLTFEVAVNLLIGAAERGLGQDYAFLLENAGLVVLIALPVVSFVALLMMAFSSLQKQRVGSNQPLGIGIGVFIVMPAYIVPLIFPPLAITVDLVLALVVIALSVGMYFLSSRLISREKLLP